MTVKIYYFHALTPPKFGTTHLNGSLFDGYLPHLLLQRRSCLAFQSALLTTAESKSGKKRKKGSGPQSSCAEPCETRVELSGRGILWDQNKPLRNTRLYFTKNKVMEEGRRGSVIA